MSGHEHQSSESLQINLYSHIYIFIALEGTTSYGRRSLRMVEKWVPLWWN